MKIELSGKEKEALEEMIMEHIEKRERKESVERSDKAQHLENCKDVVGYFLSLDNEVELYIVSNRLSNAYRPEDVLERKRDCCEGCSCLWCEKLRKLLCKFAKELNDDR